MAGRQKTEHMAARAEGNVERQGRGMNVAKAGACCISRRLFAIAIQLRTGASLRNSKRAMQRLQLAKLLAALAMCCATRRVSCLGLAVRARPGRVAVTAAQVGEHAHGEGAGLLERKKESDTPLGVSQRRRELSALCAYSQAAGKQVWCAYGCHALPACRQATGGMQVSGPLPLAVIVVIGVELATVHSPSPPGQRASRKAAMLGIAQPALSVCRQGGQGELLAFFQVTTMHGHVVVANPLGACAGARASCMQQLNSEQIGLP